NFAGCIPCTTTADRDAVLSAFYPRIPRYTFGSFNEDRLGVTTSLQWRPTERTEAVLDLMWSRFNMEAESPNIEAWAFSRAAVNQVVVRDYEIDPSKNILSYGVFDNVLIRSENGFTRDESDFYQASLNLRHEFTDRLRATAKIGANKSEARTPYNVSYAFDAAGVNGYTFDFRGDDRTPLINYGFDATSGDRFTLVERRRSTSATNFENNVAAAALEYDLNDAVSLKFGGEYRTYGFDTEGFQQASQNLAGADRVTGVDALGKVVSLDGGIDIPAGSTMSYIVPDIWAINDFISVYDDPLVPTYNGNREVDETDQGLFVQADFDTQFAGLVVRGNVGLRYARTEVESKGFQTVGSTQTYVTVNNDYEDVLPSFNLAIEPREDLVVRIGAARVMSRPSLGDLTPGGSVAPTTRRVSYGNPLLDPFRATNYDFSVEWYFQNEGLLSGAVFYKDIDSFITTLTEQVVWSDLGLPNELLQGAASPSDIFDVTRRLNGEGGSLHGFELQYQQPFTFLPGFWSDFGFIGNYTFVDSDVDYGAYGSNRLTGQSRNAFNTTLYYENDRFQARVSAAYRSQYLTAFPSANGNSEEGVNDTMNVDASMSYEITDSLTFSLEGLNLTDEYNDRYVDVTDRVSNYRHTGREIARFGSHLKCDEIQMQTTVWASSASIFALMLASNAAAQTAAPTSEVDRRNAASPTAQATPSSPPRPNIRTSPLGPLTALLGNPVRPGDITVIGSRGSLTTARNIKRNADEVVDVIVAEDIGKLPDSNASESLARVTGVQVERGGGEASRVLVRGLPDVSTSYNGRDIFTAEGRGVAMQDFPASAVAALEVFKSSSAWRLESGIAGLINVRSRRPFDFDGLEIAGSVRGTYATQSEQYDPNGDLLISNRWDTPIGEVGALVNVSYTSLRYLDSVRWGSGVVGTITDQVTDPSLVGARYPDAAGVFYGTGDRWRPSANVALQWRPNDQLELYFD
ncbi:hypothetical protein LTR94_024685, partial [Friedmanniomyces endolithicus]